MEKAVALRAKRKLWPPLAAGLRQSGPSPTASGPLQGVALLPQLGCGCGFNSVAIEPIPVIVLNTHRKRFPLLFFIKKTRGLLHKLGCWCGFYSVAIGPISVVRLNLWYSLRNCTSVLKRVSKKFTTAIFLIFFRQTDARRFGFGEPSFTLHRSVERRRIACDGGIASFNKK
jgi:hypothetical protein